MPLLFSAVHVGASNRDGLDFHSSLFVTHTTHISMFEESKQSDMEDGMSSNASEGERQPQHAAQSSASPPKPPITYSRSGLNTHSMLTSMCSAVRSLVIIALCDCPVQHPAGKSELVDVKELRASNKQIACIFCTKRIQDCAGRTYRLDEGTYCQACETSLVAGATLTITQPDVNAVRPPIVRKKRNLEAAQLSMEPSPTRKSSPPIIQSTVTDATTVVRSFATHGWIVAPPTRHQSTAQAGT
jgi:hypothetical protein